MLEELRIRGLGVIEDTTLWLTHGMNVITGETGAGKTMVVTGLGLLFGGRADAARVRSRPGRAVVEGRMRLAAGLAGAAVDLAVPADGVVDDDGSILLSRTVTLDGRSRAQVGGRAVPVSVLAGLGEQVVAVHGQTDQMRLLRPAEQRTALDLFAGSEAGGSQRHAALLAQLRERYAQWRSVETDLATRRRGGHDQLMQADLLRLGLDEISRLDPHPGEEERLRDEATRLEHAEGLRAAVAAARQAISGADTDGSGSASSLLGEARRALSTGSTMDPALAELATRLAEAAAQVADVSADLGAYLAALQADPARLQAVQERRAALRGLTRRYAEDLAGVLDWAERARSRLADLDTSDDQLAALECQRERLAGEVAEFAGQVRVARRAAADRFAAAVTAELAGLAMPHARVEVDVSPKPVVRGEPVLAVAGAECAVGPEGVDDVEIRLVAHPGAAALPLQKGASGGELSRVMLAIEVVFAGAGGPPTLVFDEVDAGVGGQAAVEVGKRLARLAQVHQILVVTHLPQVAAFADRHLVVAKDTDGSVTTSGVRVVEHTDRSRELARMLAGLPDSDLGIAHAEELLEVADRQKRAAGLLSHTR